MPLKIHNSLTQQKEEFIPRTPGVVHMYVCGPTVYDEPHIGHLRSAYAFELIRRYLQSSFCRYKVLFVRNVTDVDDKIIEKAKQDPTGDLKRAAVQISQTYFDRYKRDLSRLGISEPSVEPKATEHVDDMIKLILRLLEKGIAYVNDGDVYFSVPDFKEYGKLSHQNKEAMLESVRLDKNTKKRDSLDFALWKKSKPDEPEWPSPWGNGRPGWHVECSAMSMKYLGETFDIHGGGRDLIFPHHENEVAQSEGATGELFARTWLHHGLITVAGKKMSKSLTNFITLDEVMKADPAYGDEVLKLTFLGTHYAAPLDYTAQRVQMDRGVWRKFFEFFENARNLEKNGVEAGEKKTSLIYKSFQEAMDNDFNTPDVLTLMHALMHEAYQGKDPIAQVTVASAIRNFGSEIFGIVFDQNSAANQYKPEIEKAIARRREARKNRDFKAADEIRLQLLKERNVELRDLSDGRTTWRNKL
jgi:cysteinyl-tRNA synthetase